MALLSWSSSLSNSSRPHLPASGVGIEDALVQYTNRVQGFPLLVNFKQLPIHSWHVFDWIFHNPRVCELIRNAGENVPLHDADDLCDVLTAHPSSQHPLERRTDACTRIAWAALCRLNLGFNPRCVTVRDNAPPCLPQKNVTCKLRDTFLDL